MSYIIESDVAGLGGELVVDDETGEIIEAAGIDDPRAFLARQHDYLKALIKTCEAKLAVVDQMLLQQQSEPRVVYGDLVCARRDRRVVQVDMPAIRDVLDETELTAAELREVVAAAKSFDAKAAPPWFGDIVSAHTVETRSRPWIETAMAIREPKPVRTRDEAVA